MPSRPTALNIKDSGVVKRVSMYQSSWQIRRMNRLRDGMKNVEPDLNDDSFLSFELIDSSSLGTSESFRFPQMKKELLVPLNVKPKYPSIKNPQSLSTLNLEFLELSFRDLLEEHSKITTSYSDVISVGSSANSILEMCFQTEENNSILEKEAPDIVEKVQVEETKFSKHQFFTGLDANIIHGTDTICILPKSFSAEIGISNSYAEQEIMKSSRDFLISSLKTRFSPFKKFLEPIMKSKSLCNLSLMESRTSSGITSDITGLSRHKFFPRSLITEFSKASQKNDTEKSPSGSDPVIKTSASHAYLHAILKWEFNHGDPSFKFSVKDPEVVLGANIWKTDNPFNWVYTFHCCKMKSIMVGLGKKDRHFQPSLMIGQMLVSCNLCSEISDSESLDHSVLTEFTLYDIAQGRSIAIERSQCLSDPQKNSVLTVADSSVTECPLESNSLMETEKHRHHVRRYTCDFDSNPSMSYPWASADLLPNLEIAAIITQIPFTKKETLSNMQARDNKCCGNQDLASYFSENQIRDGGHPSPTYVKVVTPSGRHGLPNREEVGPSSLLDRSRFGGGCDCGGWDMGCPIVVFDNVNNDFASISGTQQPTVLFVKGKKENIPSLTISDNGEGQYSVDFHAQLSALQAFSICIAVLHSSEAFSAINQEKNKPMLSSNSLKLFLGEEVRHIINAVAEEKKSKGKKRGGQTGSSLFLDPPFSPMGRV